MQGHRGPVSAISLQHDERGFFSASWDGQALQWDLDTGQISRRFVTHGAQLAALAVRPLSFDYPNVPAQFSQIKSTLHPSASIDQGRQGKPSHSATGDDPSSHPGVPPERIPVDADTHSEADSLFGDEPDAEGEPDDSPDAAPSAPPLLSVPSAGPAAPPLPASLAVPSPKPPPLPAPAPKNAPPILDALSYTTFSKDIIMTAAVDGQVVLWDCRAPSSAGYGVGRLWMSEKTPPWCLSVRH